MQSLTLNIKKMSHNMTHSDNYGNIESYSGHSLLHILLRIHALSQIYPHSNWNSKLNTKLRLEFQVEYGLKLEFQLELLIRRESVVPSSRK